MQRDSFLYSPLMARRLFMGGTIALCVVSVMAWVFLFQWSGVALSVPTVVVNPLAQPTSTAAEPANRVLGWGQGGYALNESVSISDTLYIEVLSTTFTSAGQSGLREVEVAITVDGTQQVQGVTAQLAYNAISAPRIQGIDATFDAGSRTTSRILFKDAYVGECSLHMVWQGVSLPFEICKQG